MTEGISIESGSEVSSTLYHTEDTDRKQQEVLEPKQETTPLGSSIEKMKGDEALLKASSPHLRIQETKTEKEFESIQFNAIGTIRKALESNNPDEIVEATKRQLSELVSLYFRSRQDFNELSESQLPKNYTEAIDWIENGRGNNLKDLICIGVGAYLYAQTELSQSIPCIHAISPINGEFLMIEICLGRDLTPLFRDKIDFVYHTRFKRLIELVREEKLFNFKYNVDCRGMREKAFVFKHYTSTLKFAAQELGAILIRLESSPIPTEELLEPFLEQFFTNRYLNASILQGFLHTPIFPLIAKYDDLSIYRKAFELACSELTSCEKEVKWVLVHLKGAELLAELSGDKSLLLTREKGLALIEKAEKLIGQRFYYPTLNIWKWNDSWKEAQSELQRVKKLYPKTY